MNDKSDSLDWFKLVLWIWLFPVMVLLWVYKRVTEDKV
jgi:hypothetical protein